MLLLSILITLAVVEGDIQPFTAFSHAAMQFSRVNAPDPAPIIKRQTIDQPIFVEFRTTQLDQQIKQVQQPIDVEFRKTRPVQQIQKVRQQKLFESDQTPVEFKRPQPLQQGQQRIQPIGGQYQYQGPFNSFGTSFSAFFRASGNIVEQTRTQADSTKALLKALGKNRKAVKYIDAHIDGSNKCLDNLDDAIDAIENAAKIVEKNGPEILSLFEVVEQLEEEKDLTRVVKISAEIIRQLSVLAPSFANEPSKLCNASPEETIESFFGLAEIIDDVSNAKDLQISSGVREKLKKSSKIVYDMTTFLGKLNKSLSSFGQFCGQGKEYQNEFFFAVVPVLEDLAVLFEGFGFAEKANGFRKNGAFIEKLVATFDDLDIDSDVDCGSFTALADVLDGLAEVIDSVGVDLLSEQLGLDLAIF